MVDQFQFEMIAFDADDTLWHSERFYEDSKEGLYSLLAPYGVEKAVLFDTLQEVEQGHLPIFGYGIKAFTLSMIETAVKATGEEVRARDVQAIIDLGRAMVGHEMRLLDYVKETVLRLSESHPLMIITKGDLMDQERKIDSSGLVNYFQHVEIVSDKTVSMYKALLERYNITPARFLMIGNSMRSDILPVLNLGGYAVFVPYELAWEHESGTLPTGMEGRFREIGNLNELPALVANFESRATGG